MTCRYPLIARSPKGYEAIQIFATATGLLRGACHRAGRFGPDRWLAMTHLPKRGNHFVDFVTAATFCSA